MPEDKNDEARRILTELRQIAATHPIRTWLRNSFIILILLLGLDHALDYVMSPWAYGLFGNVRPQGDWVGAAEIKNGGKYQITLKLTHSPVLGFTNPTKRPEASAIAGTITLCLEGSICKQEEISAYPSWRGSKFNFHTKIGFIVPSKRGVDTRAPETFICYPDPVQLNCEINFNSPPRKRKNMSPLQFQKLMELNPELRPEPHVEALSVTFTRP